MIANPQQPQTAPLVGMHFRPPAKAILRSLPAAYPLELRPEPTNPYDANAIAVWFDAKHLSDDSMEELRHTLPSQGSDIDDLCAQRFWHIGYVAKEAAAIHQADIAMIIEGHNVGASVSGEGFLWTGYPARLGFDGSGKPLVMFNI